MNVYIPQLMNSRKNWRYHTKFSCVQSLKLAYKYVSLEEAHSLGFDVHCMKCQTKKTIKGG